MQTFFTVLSDWLVSQEIIPKVAQPTDESQEDKTFWQIFPEDDNQVDNCVLLAQYNSLGDSYRTPGALLYAMQIVVRNRNHSQAMQQAEIIADKLRLRSTEDPFIDVSYWIKELIEISGYFLLRCDNGPTRLNEDAQGRFLYSVSFYVTTNIKEENEMAQIGLRDLYIAILNEDTATKSDYETPERIIGAITANVNPNSSSATLFADDGPMDTASTLGEIELELNTYDLPLPWQAKLLGHSYDEETGLLKKGANDVAPWVACGFRSLKSDGSYRYFWLTKGKFRPTEENIETKGDTINFQTPTITGSFAKRTSDDQWELVADSSNPASAALVNTWYTVATLNVNSASVISVTGVSLNKNSTSIEVGSDETLVATVIPVNATNQNVTWNSGDQTVATVDSEGKVTALQAGTTNITVTTQDGNYTAVCGVTVTAAPVVISVTGVTLDESTATLAPNGTKQLTATVAPADATNKAVTWSSSAEGIATVSDDGLVTAVADGEATITVTTVDGSFTDTCTVTVTT